MPSYHLTELIDSLSKEEIRNFKLYATRINNTSTGENKAVMLFDCIKDGMDEFGDDIVEKLYSGGNKNAFYRLKNRLISDIEQSLLLLNRNKDQRFKVFNIIQLANVFRYKSDYDQASAYLVKAEKLAKKFGYYDLLDTIYGEILSLASDYYKINPEEYVDKKRANYSQLGNIQEVDFLLATINYKLRNANYTGKDTALEEELADIVKRLDIREDIIESLDVQFKIHKCYSFHLLQKRDFKNLEGYLVEQLAKFEKLGFFDNARYEDQFRLILWIINCSHINYNFERAKKYIDKLNKALDGQNKKYYDKYLWMYHECLVVNYAFMNKDKEMVELLLELRDNPDLSGTNFYDIFVFVNLATQYYKLGNLKKAQENMLPLTQTDLTKKLLNKSIQLQIILLDMIFHYENRDYNYVIYRISETKRIFRQDLKKEEYGREKEFLGILKELCSKADPLRDTKIVKRIEEFIEKSRESVPGTGEPVNYKVFLQSKLDRESYAVAIKKVQEKHINEVRNSQNRTGTMDN